MATLPRISVVTVTFNAEAELEKTLRSVAAQTYGDLEFLLIDGGSRDNTRPEKPACRRPALKSTRAPST